MASVNNSSPASGGGLSNLPPINPFFSVPDLSPDGDFEVLGVNVHHTLVPPQTDFFALPDLSFNDASGALDVPDAPSIFNPNKGDLFYGILPNPIDGHDQDSKPSFLDTTRVVEW